MSKSDSVLIGYNDKPAQSKIDTFSDLEREYKIFQDYIEAYNQEKDKQKEELSREDVLDSKRAIMSQSAVEVVTTNQDIPDQFKSAAEHIESEIGREITDFYGFLTTKLQNEAQNTLKVKHAVHIKQDKANEVVKTRGVDDSAKGDSFERDGNEDNTGQFSEVAFEELLAYSQQYHDLDFARIPDEQGIYAGDFLINDYIVELKSCKATSLAQNITHRNHNHPTTGSMYFKQGILPEIYAHSVVLDLREYGGGVIIGFSGITPVLPQYDGVFGQSNKITSGYMINFVDELEWAEVTDFGWHQIKNKIEKIDF